jgi:peptidoglycan/LPS O-acetylase OafA/YrhL
VLVYSCTTNDGALSASRESFWRARFARIYPTYLVALLIDAPWFVSALMKAHDGVAVVTWGIFLGATALLLVHAWTPLTVFGWNTPGWSVSAEAFFYSVFPAAAPRLRCRSLREFLTRGTVLYGLALVPPLLLLAARLWGGPVMHLRVPSGGAGLEVGVWLERFLGFSPIARLPEFLIGVCLGHWLRARRSTPSVGQAAMLEVAVVASLLLAWIGLGANPGAKLWLDSGLLAPLFVALIATLALGVGPLARFLSIRPLQVLGEASYAMYILQEPVLIWALRLPMIGSQPRHVFVPFYVLLLIVLSMACQRYIAEPARLWLIGRANQTRGRTLQAVREYK